MKKRNKTKKKQKPKSGTGRILSIEEMELQKTSFFNTTAKSNRMCDTTHIMNGLGYIHSIF